MRQPYAGRCRPQATGWPISPCRASAADWLPLDPQDTQKPKTLNTWFEFELELPATRTFVLGEHVYARFEHEAEPVAWRIYRSVRQLFLKRFSV